MRSRGIEWIWFDPIEQVLGVGLDDERLAGPLGCLARTWHGQHIGIAPFALAQATLTETGIRAPVLERLRAERVRIRELDAERAKREAENAARRSQEQAIATRAARDRFRRLLDGLTTRDHPAVARLIAAVPDGGAVIAEGLCEGTLRLEAVRFPGRIGAPAHEQALALHLEDTAAALAGGSVDAETILRVAADLRASGWIADDRFVGSLDAPPGTMLASDRLASRFASPVGPSSQGTRSRAGVQEPARTLARSSAPDQPGAHDLVSRRGPRLALVEASERDGVRASASVLRHLLACESCRRHRWGGALSFARAVELTGADLAVPSTASAAKRLHQLNPAELAALGQLLDRALSKNA